MHDKVNFFSGTELIACGTVSQPTESMVTIVHLGNEHSIRERGLHGWILVGTTWINLEDNSIDETMGMTYRGHNRLRAWGRGRSRLGWGTSFT